MRKWLASFVVLMFTAMMPWHLHAETVFNYDGFYARMKKSEKPEYSQVTLTFILQQRGKTELCEVEKAEITTDVSKDSLTVASNGELILPYDEVYNQRKALIRIYQKPNAVPCDLNFRLRNKMPLGAELSLLQLRTLHHQFDALLQELAGLGRYFLPEMSGVTLQFAAAKPALNSHPQVEKATHCSAQQCQVDLRQLTALADDIVLRLHQAPTYISPFIQRQ